MPIKLQHEGFTYIYRNAIEQDLLNNFIKQHITKMNVTLKWIREDGIYYIDMKNKNGLKFLDEEAQSDQNIVINIEEVKM